MSYIKYLIAALNIAAAIYIIGCVITLIATGTVSMGIIGSSTLLYTVGRGVYAMLNNSRQQLLGA
jgi:uncharacterized membrane protein